MSFRAGLGSKETSRCAAQVLGIAQGLNDRLADLGDSRLHDQPQAIKHSHLHSVAHNFADSLVSGSCLIIGRHAVDAGHLA